MGVKFSNSNPAAPGGMTLATIQKDPATGEVSVAVTPGGGSVTHTGNLTADQVVVGNGVADVKILAGPADATKFLNGASVPGFANVKDSDLSLSNITTNDVSISQHGFAPKAPNDATKFLDGTGAYTTPAGGGTVTHTGTLSSGQLIKGNGGADIAVGDLSGDATTSGSLVVTNVNLPDGVTQAGKLVATAITAPGTPLSGKDNLYVDSTDKRFHDKNDAGAIGTTVVSDTGAGSNFLTAISAAGVISKAQPSFSDLSVATGDVSFSTAAAHKITNVHDPASAQDAATKSYVDANVGSSNATSIRGVSVDATTPFDQQVLKYFSSTASWTPAFYLGPWASFQWMSSANNSVQGVFTNTVTSSGANFGNVACTATLPPGISATTSTSASSTTGLAGGLASVSFKFTRMVNFQFKLLQTTNMRIWIGLGRSLTASVYQSDQPATNFVGIRFSPTVGGDTKWQCVSQVGSGGGQQTINAANSGTGSDTPDATTTHNLQIRWDDTNAIFLMDGVQIGSQSGNIPADANAIAPVVFIDNAATANGVGFNLHNIFWVGKTV